VVEGRIYRAESVADPDNAIKAFRRAIRESKSFNPEAHTGLALAYRDKEDYAAAVNEFKIAINQLADTEPIVYQLLGETYDQMQRPKEAIAAYEKYLELAPNSTQAQAIRSIVEQLKRKEKGESIELLPQ
jgi:tetratricopeptide (TPR) repeat protein